MANQTYVPSRCIHVFPCATRTYDTNNASKFLTQYNLTNFLGGGKSYNLTKQNDLYMRFSIKGYFVQIDYTSQQGKTWWENFLTAAKPQAEQVLCAQINLAAAVSQSGDFVDTGNVNNQSKLTGFADPVSKKTPLIDADIGSNGESVFTALKLAFLSTDAFDKLSDSVKLATVVEDTENQGQNKLQWQLYSESLKFTQVSTSVNNPNITIQLSQDPVTKEISATAKYAEIGTDQLGPDAVTTDKLDDNAVTYAKMNIDSTAYGVTENAADTDSLRVQLVENTQGSKLKAQLLGLVRTADIANNAVTAAKLGNILLAGGTAGREGQKTFRYISATANGITIQLRQYTNEGNSGEVTITASGNPSEASTADVANALKIGDKIYKFSLDANNVLSLIEQQT